MMVLVLAALPSTCSLPRCSPPRVATAIGAASRALGLVVLILALVATEENPGSRDRARPRVRARGLGIALRFPNPYRRAS
jgi:hypothetical protein